MLLVNNVVGDDSEDVGEQSRYRDSLERADFADKLSRFERLTSSRVTHHTTDHSPSSRLSDYGPSSRPSSAPLTLSARGHGTTTEQLRHSASDSAPVITFPALRGLTRRGHRVGVVETPTGDLDLDATSPPPPSGISRSTDEVIQINADPSVDFWTSSVPPSRKSLEPCVKRHGGTDRLADIKAAILASAAAKLSSPTRVLSARSNNISPDSLPAPSTGCDGLQRPDSVECGTASSVAGTDNCLDDSRRRLDHSDEQSSECSRSSLSSDQRTHVSPTTTEKPPTGRTPVESACSLKQSDRRNFDKASAFFRSLLSRSRSPSPSGTSPSRSGKSAGPGGTSPARSGKSAGPVDAPRGTSPTRSGKSAGPGDPAVNGSRTQDQGTSKTTLLVSSQRGHLPAGGISCSESSSSTRSSAGSSHRTSQQGRDLLYAANSHSKSHSEHSSPLTQCSKTDEHNTLSTASSTAVRPRHTVTSNFVIPGVGKNSDESVALRNPPAQAGKHIHLSDDGRARSTAERVINAAGRELRHSEQLQTSVDVSPRVRKVVTFAAERNTDRSVGVGLGDEMNGQVEVELDKSSNNNAVMISDAETVQLNTTASESDVPQSDVSNANTLRSHSEGTTAAIGINNSPVSNKRQVVLSSTDSALNGHESNDFSSAMEADDTASVSDFDGEELSASQQDLRTLYQRRRAERVQEQKAAELEKQRLEEILRLYTEFGLTSDVTSSTGLVSADDVAEKMTERQNSVGRIKTNGSLTKLPGLPASGENVEQRRLNQSGSGLHQSSSGLNQGGSGSNSDDDVDHGTIRRRPVTTKRSVDGSTSKTTYPGVSVASDVDKRATLARTGSGGLPPVGLSVESSGRSKSVPMIDTSVTSLVDGELERLLQSNVDFSLPTSADWRVHPGGIVKSSMDWYSAASLPEYSSIWDSVNTWKSSQHRVRTQTVFCLVGL